MVDQHDNEDSNDSSKSNSTLSKRLWLRNLHDWFDHRTCHHGHDDHHFHDRGHRLPRMPHVPHYCRTHQGSSDESLPAPLFVGNDLADIESTDPLYQSIKLSVSGMTCSGCEKSLQRALERIPSAKDIRTDMATSQAQVSIDVNAVTVDEVLRRLRRTTPYGVKRISEAKEGLRSLDVLVSDPEHIFRGTRPAGVMSVRCQSRREDLGKKEVRIEYDPQSILPRDLMEKALADEKAVLAPIPPPESVSAGRRLLHRQLVYFLVALIFTIPVLVLEWGASPGHGFTKQIICLSLATAVQASAWEFYPNAFKSLFHSKIADMDLLIVLSTTTAYIFSVVAMALSATGNPLSEDSFFETSTLLVTLIRFGRLMSELARQKATESASIRTLQSPTAQLLNRTRSESREMDVRLLQLDDVFRVPPHSRIPTDGVVVYGGSQVDESMMTGESRPVAKGIDSRVVAGTMNLDGQLDVSVTRLVWDNSISTIGDLVDSAELTKPRIQALADRVASFFVPVMLVISAVVFLVWILVGIFISGKSKGDAAVDAVTYAIATLIVSCPCAIGLAVPMVLVIASGVAAKHGVIFRAPSAIETAKNVRHVVFDKTGTLTQGRMTVISEKFLAESSASTLSYILGLVSGQRHPVAAAVAEWIISKGPCEAMNFDTTTVVVGGGIEGVLDEGRLVVRAGNCDWLGISSSEPVSDFAAKLASSPSTPSEDTEALEHSMFGVTVNGEPWALFALRDVLRPETASVVAFLQTRHHASIHIVSGDDARSVAHCAQLLHVPSTRMRARCSPGDKAGYVSSLQKAEPGAIVLFVGDGTNDAVALTQATIGMSVAGGSDVAKSAADIVLVRPDLRGLAVALDVSARAVRRVHFNFAWALIYNLAAVLFAAGAFVWVGGGTGIKIPPGYAGLGEIASVLPVVLIAFSLRFAKFRGCGAAGEGGC